MDSERQVENYGRSVTRRLYMGWAIAFIAVLSIIGWGLDLSTGLTPFPAIKWALIVGAGILASHVGLRTKQNIVDKDAEKSDMRGELAKIYRIRSRQDVRSLAELRKSLESEEGTGSSGQKIEPRLDD